MKCDRCDATVERGHPLDGVVHPYESVVCGGCLKPGDEVVQV